MPNQFTIIDGYNLLHHCGIIGRGVGPGTLRRARGLLLGILKRHLGEPERGGTTIVYDSSFGRGDFDDQQTDSGIEIRFATGEDEADDLIERLIRRHSAPKQLTVVSSDHRIQRAAKRRGAGYVDSADWFDQLLQTAEYSGDQPPDLKNTLDQVRNRRLDKNQIDQWIEVLDLTDEIDSLTSEFEPNKTVNRQGESNNTVDRQGESKNTVNRQGEFKNTVDRQGESNNTVDRQGESNKNVDRQWSNPFPPGYAEDLLDDGSE